MVIMVLLWFNGLAFLLFGIACFVDPGIVTEMVGYGLTRADTEIEVRAMYGGAQSAIGLFMLLGARVERFREASLVFTLMVYSGLCIARISGLLLVADDVAGPGSFTYAAASFEGAMAFASAVVLARK